MLLAGADASAQAPPGPPPLRDPATVGVGWYAGADVWSGGGGPASELRASLAGRLAPRVDAAGWATVEGVWAVDGPRALDQHGLRVGWSAPSGALLRAGVMGAGSGPWLEASADAGVGLRLGATRWTGSIGGGLRGGGPSIAPLGRAELALDAPLGPVTSHTGLRAAVHGAPLPPLSFAAEQWLGLGERLRAELGLAGQYVLPTDRAAVPGLPTPGTWVTQGLVAAIVPLGERWRLRAEFGPELARGAIGYERLRAFAGVAWTLGRRADPAPEARDGVVRFELRAPGARTVEVLGAFTGWRPVAMTPGPGDWWALELRVADGSWEFTYRVDGETRVPPAADRWVPDGFGGTNGVLVVH